MATERQRNGPGSCPGRFVFGGRSHPLANQGMLNTAHSPGDNGRAGGSGESKSVNRIEYGLLCPAVRIRRAIKSRWGGTPGRERDTVVPALPFQCLETFTEL